MYLFKTRKAYNVIYCQSVLKAFEIQHGKLLIFFWSRQLRSSVKKAFLKISKKFTGKHLRRNLYFHKFTCLRPATFWIKETPTQVSVNFLEHLFFRTPPSNCFWILHMKIKLLRTKFLIDGFILTLKFHIQIILHSNKYQKACKVGKVAVAAFLKET